VTGSQVGGTTSPGVSEHRIRFGIQAGRGLDEGPDGWTALARRAEALGYSTLLVPDHFFPVLAPIPAMMAAAAATTRLRVGSLVLANDFRHPAVLAKELATIDLLSGGRLEVGLGAGWLTADYTSAGIVKDRDGVRIERMLESLHLMRDLWSAPTSDFRGDHYRVTGMAGYPRPVQQPGPRVLIGGGGPRVLALAAREADIVGINPSLHSGGVGSRHLPDLTADAVDEKVGWVRQAAGTRESELELNLLVARVDVGPGAEARLPSIAAELGLSTEQAASSPYLWVGTVDAVAERILAARERWGLTYWVVRADAMEAVHPLVARLGSM
jgi:probable F420-dependent oxidoreductase